MTRRRDPHDDPPIRRTSRRQPEGPPGTLQEAADDEPGWFWVYCASVLCSHHKAVRAADLVAKYGPARTLDFVRRNARCSRCGGKGATLRRASWQDRIVGWAPFPGRSR